MKKKAKKGPVFDAAAAYNAPEDDETMGQSGASQSTADNDADDPNGNTGDSSQGLNFPPEQVAQMQQLKAQGNMQALGEYVAQYLQ